MTGVVENILRRFTLINKYPINCNPHSSYYKQKVNTILISRFCSVSTSKDDPAPIFFDYKVQKILKLLTRPDPKRVFRRKFDSRRISEASYKFVTDEELREVFAKANIKMKKMLQMPPVLKVAEDNIEILSEDPYIEGHDESKYVFTDITFGLQHKDRFVVIREPDGTLRTANCDEKKRMLQVYFPSQDRKMHPPKMFSHEYFEDLLNRHEFEFILNVAANQYDPDEREWVRITHAVYDYINDNKLYNILLSTRFYGPMVFYFAWEKNIDNILLENLKHYRFTDAVWLVQLYHLIHPDCQSAKLENNGDDLDFIMQYVQNDSKNKGKLEMAINKSKEWKEAQKQIEENIKQAHGV